jgi:hypothetical protein
MWVSGTRTGEPISIDIVADVTSSVRVIPRPGMTVRRTGSLLRVCSPVTGPGPFRRVAIDFAVTRVPQPVPSGQRFGIPSPDHGLRLIAVRATARTCRR